MPLLLESRVARSDRRARPVPPQRERRRPDNRWRPSLEIGLLNNMPDAALKATERQFADLLEAATGERVVRLHLFGLPEVPRGAPARTYIETRYADIGDLKSGRLDALIVTGSEPKTPSLDAEPYWQALTDVIDWAEGNTISTLWSCLAAHAAVLHLDGIARRRLPAKRSGLFACRRLAEDTLLEGLPETLVVPHSRWNDLSADDLRLNGYRVLTGSEAVGVDLFVKRWKSLFVFVQGHPEYAQDTLFREYRRDVTRFLRGERLDPPDLPVGYFDAPSAAVMSGFARDAAKRGGGETPIRFPVEWAVEPRAYAVWRQSAVGLYRNWLDHVAALKART